MCAPGSALPERSGEPWTAQAVPPPAPTGRRSAGDPDSDPLVALGLKVPGPTSGEGDPPVLGCSPFPSACLPVGRCLSELAGLPVTSRRGTRLWARGAVAAVSVPLGPACSLLLKLSGSRIQGGAGGGGHRGVKANFGLVAREGQASSEYGSFY